VARNRIKNCSRDAFFKGESGGKAVNHKERTQREIWRCIAKILRTRKPVILPEQVKIIEGGWTGTGKGEYFILGGPAMGGASLRSHLSDFFSDL